MDLTSFLNIFRDYLGFTGRKNVRAEMSLLLENSDKHITFPVVPADLPEINIEQKNDVFESIIGDVSVIGLLGLRTIEFEDILLPSDISDYTWAKGDNASDIINFINDNRQTGQPFRLVITKDNITYCNMSVLIDNFTYHQDNMCDYHANISFKEYRTYNEQMGTLEA